MERMSVPASGVPRADPGVAALADQCVMCGLCLPHCPTYRLERTEAESPRGRIALARALAEGRLAPGAATLAHLDHCLGCLSCQKVCPSQVRYEDLLVQTRAALVAATPPGHLQRWLHSPHLLRRLARLGATLRVARWLPRVARLLPRGSRGRRLVETVPAAPRVPGFAAPRRAAPATGRAIALVRGCVGSVYEADTLAAARVLLEAAGHRVVELDRHCCGALPRHGGFVEAAAHEAAATRHALLALRPDVVLGCSSGCHGDLRDEVAAGTTLAVPDIHAFLAADPGFDALRFRPLARRAALHLPCTQVNVAGGLEAIRALLARVPQLAVLELPGQPRCCGAAGSYFIEHPAFADRLRAEKLDQAAALAPDLLLTTNIGCRIHLGNGLAARTSALPVHHPLTLLAMQLETDAGT
ncbi:glycolate oxidase iron-sulfur subunit [Dokdonella fugitiva]|jgi:glycolate oxidase iron-sulfur subunit|uniref:Glycolate oxidase iron-sulfur subunit n=2 Tax=Dokdonella fugitiva TaxID=328517 RepID=A0A4R2IGQ1_9GAMM|nr:glycolate oxidase iron-sulfur subunit [Dokdonella fugitiva]